ncbi:MAG TPA: D-glucuronyl C5-epimerase family protein [Candidatus Acidoferrales bacterium]|nr:D-glucuronyl C5-epimerase family protein [Candidatus Acidoferrales bacterium]
MSALRRLALGFPVAWSHRRAFHFDEREAPATGRYFVEWDPGHGVYGEDWDGGPFDGEGVLLSGSARRYHPIRIAQFALHRFGVWLDSGDPAARRDFLAQARWLRDAQRPDTGLYHFEFPWSKYGAGAGWTSAMAQGEAISVLLRADTLEPSNGWSAAAIGAARPFAREIGHGGVVWRGGDDVFLEEIANQHAPHVLNGCIFALWGIWELQARTGDAGLAGVVASTVATLLRWLPRFDTGWWSLYSLMADAGGQPHVATLKYHEFHIAQLSVLAKMFGERAFEDVAQRWRSYEERHECRRRVIGSSLRSLPGRFFGRDTVAGGARA